MKNLKDKSLFREAGLIGGRWIAAGSGRTVDVLDPATQTTIGTVPDMGGPETRAAIEAAALAYGNWKKKTNAERAALLEAWHGLMLAESGSVSVDSFAGAQLSSKSYRSARLTLAGAGATVGTSSSIATIFQGAWN